MLTGKKLGHRVLTSRCCYDNPYNSLLDVSQMYLVHMPSYSLCCLKLRHQSHHGNKRWRW